MDRHVAKLGVSCAVLAAVTKPSSPGIITSCSRMKIGPAPPSRFKCGSFRL